MASSSGNQAVHESVSFGKETNFEARNEETGLGTSSSTLAPPKPIVGNKRKDDKLKQFEGYKESAEFKKQALDPLEDSDLDESDFEEEDVKVCDICGDAGREDLLAVCSRCTDGAEHTYCMRDMLEEVPDHDWLCEECKLTVEMEKQKLENPGTLAIKERNKWPSSASGMKMDKKDLSSSSSKVDNTSSAKGILPVDSIEIEPVMKRQYVESALATPSTSSSGQIASLSRENSFRGSDKMNVKQSSENSRSTKANLPQASMGTFVKSNSFGTSGSKPKVRSADEIPPKKEGLDGKDGSSKVVGKSMSFKGNLNRSAAAESKVKMLSPEDSHILESRGLKQAKDHILFERKNSLKSDTSLVIGNAGKLQARGEAKKQYPGVCGSSSLNPVDPKPIDIVCKETLLSTSSQLEGSLNSQTDRTLEKSYKSCREGAAVGTSSGNQRSMVADSSLPRRLKEGASEENKLKAAIQAAMQKKLDMDKKNRTSEKSNLVSVSNMDSYAETPSIDKLSNLVNARNFSSSGMEAAVPRSSFSSCKEASLNSSVQSKLFSANHVLPSKERDLNLVSCYDGLMLTRVVIPEQDSMWQGSFEVHRNGIIKDRICGFQAHLATTASYKVCEIVKKFPQKVTLAEVPRSHTWPTQFKDTVADVDNIAVYFFAKDIESYQKRYKYLLEKMMKDDLALIGNIDGCELLIFSSKNLTEKSQRWNMLSFLWGVFRGRRSSSYGSKTFQVNSVSICEAPLPSTLVNGNRGSKGFPLDLTDLYEVAGTRHHENRPESQSEVASIATRHQPTWVEELTAEEKMGAESQQVFREAGNAGISSNGEAELLKSGDQVMGLRNDSLEASSSVPRDDMAVKEKVSPSPEYKDSRPGGGENNGENCMDTLGDQLEVKLEESGGSGVMTQQLSQTNSLVKNLLDFPNRKCPKEQQQQQQQPQLSATYGGRLPLTDLNVVDVDEGDVVIDMDMTEDMDIDMDEDENHTDKGVVVTGSSSLHGSHSDEARSSSMSLDRSIGFENIATNSSAASSFLFSTTDSLNTPAMLAESLTLRVSSSSLASGKGDRSADGLPTLELALGAENKRSTPPPSGGLFLSPGERDQNIPAGVSSGALREGEKEGGTASLSLSLAFPFSDKDRTSG